MDPSPFPELDKGLAEIIHKFAAMDREHLDKGQALDVCRAIQKHLKLLQEQSRQHKAEVEEFAKTATGSDVYSGSILLHRINTQLRRGEELNAAITAFIDMMESGRKKEADDAGG